MASNFQVFQCKLTVWMLAVFWFTENDLPLEQNFLQLIFFYFLITLYRGVLCSKLDCNIPLVRVTFFVSHYLIWGWAHKDYIRSLLWGLTHYIIHSLHIQPRIYSEILDSPVLWNMFSCFPFFPLLIKNFKNKFRCMYSGVHILKCTNLSVHTVQYILMYVYTCDHHLDQDVKDIKTSNVLVFK